MRIVPLKPDWFLIGMAAAVVLAWLFPEPGAAGGWLYPELLTKAGVALIFFLHGVSLSFASLKEGTYRWPVHLTIQACTFLLFPLLGLGFLAIGGAWMPIDLRTGFFFLCALPSTVSSSVALTAAAHGNVAVAVFNATLSSLIGIFLTPLWIGLVVQTSGQSMPMGGVILDLVLWLLLPLLVGQASRVFLAGWAARQKKRIGLVDRGTILLLVYTSFCDSFEQGVWSAHGLGPVVATFAGTLLLFFVILALTTAISQRLGFSRGDRIAAIFCGSKKTLASGIPMAQLIFAGHPGIGLILLPIMVYHPLQLIICGVLAGRWAREDAERTAALHAGPGASEPA